MQISHDTIVSFLSQHVYHWLGGARDELAGFGKGHPMAYRMQLVASSVMIGDNKL